MRVLRMLLLIHVVSTMALGQGRSFLTGETKDCFAGKLIHPARVDIYLLDPLKSREIAAILNDMEKQAPNGNGKTADAFFASYQHLLSATRKIKPLAHVRSDETGGFVFRSLRDGMPVLLLGIAEREDDPAYYAFTRVKLRPGKNSVILDFDRGDDCTPR